MLSRIHIYGRYVTKLNSTRLQRPREKRVFRHLTLRSIESNSRIIPSSSSPSSSLLERALIGSSYDALNHCSRDSMEGIGGSVLFESLPIPCIYLSTDAGVLHANRAARNLIPFKTGTLVGNSIFDSNFTDDYLEDPKDLQVALDRLLKVTRKNHRGVDSVVHNGQDKAQLDVNSYDTTESNSERRKRVKEDDIGIQDTVVLRSAQVSSLQWHISIAHLADTVCFSLIANRKPSWKDFQMSKDEEFDFLLSLAEPTFKNVPHYVNIMHADKETLQVNGGAVQNQPRLADAFSRKLPLGIWNDSFTTPLSLADGVAATSLRAKQGNVSTMRGVENPEDGMRTIHDCTTTVLQNPFSREILGAILQVREAQEYSDWLQQLDILDCRNAAVADGRLPIMVRTMLNSCDIDYFSNSWEDFTKTDRRSLLGSWSSWFHPDDLMILKDRMDSSMESGQSCEYQVRLRRGDGWHHFKERFAPLRQHGSIIRWYFISTDINELVDERNAAVQATDRLYRIINSMHIIIFEVDETWKVTQAEGALEVSTSEGQTLTASDYPGHTLHEICTIIRPGGIDELMDELIKVMDGQQGKVVVDYKLGEQYLRTIAIPGVDKSLCAGKRLFGITLDRSAEHASENARLQLETMQETERLKSQFLANISHELRTPISGLIGILELLRDTTLTDLQEDYISTLDSSSQSLLVIVNDVLDLSKAEAGRISIHKVPFNLMEVLNDLHKSNEILAANKGLALNYHISPIPPNLLGDAGRIRQILQNILGNAIKFTQTGSVTMRTECVIIGSHAKLTIDITDTGIGIDTQTMAVLFRPFVQADQSDTRVYGGTGLGLSIARKFAQLMGGNVVLESEKNKGTRARISLELDLVFTPLSTIVQDRKTIQASKDRPGIEVNRDTQHVLVVEDNKINQRVLQFHLHRLGFKHNTFAENGAEAVAYVKSSLEDKEDKIPVPDVILMDCQMPVLDGYKATQLLRRELGFDRPIIALTASAIQGDREKCLAAGMDDHISKPVSQKTLDQIFKKWLKP